MACQQGTLTLPDTWFRPPFWDLLMFQLLRPDFQNLPCLYSTFHFEYPSVLSRFCLTHFKCQIITKCFESIALLQLTALYAVVDKNTSCSVRTKQIHKRYKLLYTRSDNVALYISYDVQFIAKSVSCEKQSLSLASAEIKQI